MLFREFIFPDDAQWLDALGLESEPVDGEASARRVHFEADSGDCLDFIFDIAGNSIRCSWSRDNVSVLEIFREGARRLQVSSGGGVANLKVEFEVEGLRGTLDVQLIPSIRVNDVLLFF